MIGESHTTRITEAIARNTGKRWCSTCQMDKPAEGFKKIKSRWVCADCRARRKAGVLPPRILSSTKRGI